MTKKTILPETIFYNFFIALIALILSWLLGGPWMDFETRTTLTIALFLFTIFLAIAVWAKLNNIEKTIEKGNAISGPYQYTRHPIFFAAVFFFNPALVFLLKSWLILIAIIPIFFIWHNAARNQELFLAKEYNDKYRHYRLVTPLFFPNIFGKKTLFYAFCGLFIFFIAFISLNFSSYYFRYAKWDLPETKITLSGNTAANNLETPFKLPKLEKIIQYEKPNSIVIEKIGLTAPLIFSQEKTQKEIEADLNNGVVAYPGSVLPGEIGNLFITGHSSIYPWNHSAYGKVFAALDKLEAGDKVIVYYNKHKFEYKITNKYVAHAQDVRLVHPDNEAKITLFTCWPIGTNLKRLALEGALSN
jgi:LPXTG-site transpeptidase (sortase) family protein